MDVAGGVAAALDDAGQLPGLVVDVVRVLEVVDGPWLSIEAR